MAERDRKFDLGDYVEVKERIARFYELYGNGRLVTAEVQLTREPDDVPRVLVKAYAYRTPDDIHPGVGWSWMELPGKTSYTKGSELENVETSAWGRAIGSLGILIDRSIASAQEVDNKREPAKVTDGLVPHSPAEAGPPVTMRGGEQVEILGKLAKTGIVRKGGSERYKLEPRETPDGMAIGFRLELDGDRDIPQILADGELGHALFLATGSEPERLLGKEVKVKGRLYNVRADGRRPFYRLLLTDIETSDFTLPAPAGDGEVPPEPVPFQEFSEDENRAIDAALAVK